MDTKTPENQVEQKTEVKLPDITAPTPFYKSRKVILGIVAVILVLLLGIGGILMSNSKKSESQITPTPAPVSRTPTKAAFNGFPSATIVPNQLLVKFVDNFSPDTPPLKEKLETLGVTSSEKILNTTTGDTLYLLKFGTVDNLEEAAKQIHELEEVVYVSPNTVSSVFPE